jgi:hypothetical protein
MPSVSQYLYQLELDNLSKLSHHLFTYLVILVGHTGLTEAVADV